MLKQIGKHKLIILLVLICMLLACIGVNFGLLNKSTEVYAASDNSIFTFTQTSETECNVRLKDKTVEEAIIPSMAIIDGKEYVVTSVVGNGFASSANLTKVWLPKTIKDIGNAAFANCKNLKMATLSAVENIGTNAFNLCNNLDYLILPKTVKSIGATILRSTNTQVYVRATQEEVQNLDWNANWNGNNENQTVIYKSDFTPEVQYQLVELSVFGLNSKIGDTDGYIVTSAQPFSEYRDEEVHVKIPAFYEGKPVVAIADNAFSYNELTSLTVCYSNTPIFIDSFAFNGLDCEKVIINRDVDIYNGESYSEYLFADSLVDYIYLPDTLNAIGPYMFNNCYDLKDVHFIHPDNSVVDENINITSTNIIYLPKKDENVAIEGIKYIGEESFSNCTCLSEINIPKNVEVVGASILNGWGGSQSIIIDYSQASELPSGWNNLWNSGCDTSIIQFNGIYKITYVLNGGNHTGNPNEYTSRDTIVLNDATLEGNKFDGWYDNEAFTGEPITVIKGSSGDITLYAKFTHNLYKVIYHPNQPNNASENVDGITLDSTHEFSVSSRLSQNGYSLKGWGFVGWNTASDGSGTSYVDRQEIFNLTIKDNEKINMFAQWSPNSYTVIYNPNKPQQASGLLEGTISSSNFIYDSQGYLNANKFTLEGWSFVNWNTQADGNGNSFSDIAEIKNISIGITVTLYAQWTQNKYDIVYDSNKPSNASGTINGSMPKTSMTYDVYKNLEANVYKLTGWTFVNWNTKLDGTGISYGNRTNVRNVAKGGTVKLYAQWKPKEYRIVYNYGISPDPKYGTVMGSTPVSYHTYDTTSYLSECGYYLLPPTGVSNYIQKVVGWATAEGGSKVYDIDAQVSNLNAEDGGTTYLYAVWDFVRYSVYRIDPRKNPNDYSLFWMYTYEQEVIIPNISYNGMYYEYETDYIPKHTVGDIYVSCNIREIRYQIYYTVVCEDAFGNRKPVKDMEKIEVSYNQEVTFTTTKYWGYTKSAVFLMKDDDNGKNTANPVTKEWKWVEELTVKQLGRYEGHYVWMIQQHYGTAETDPPPSCVAEDTLITLADGSQKAVQNLDGSESLLVWNLFTGTFDTAPILFIDSDPERIYEVINLYFSDGTNVKVISEHAFWDFDLNEYVFLRNDADKYIGHWFNKQGSEGLSWEKVQLIDVKITKEVTTAWSPVTYGHLCYYVNGMLSMPGATEGLINIFEVDSETLKINETLMQADIEQYGLFTYEVFEEIYPITE